MFHSTPQHAVMSAVRRLLTPPMLVAIAAVVLAVGGTATATALIGGQQIRNSSVTGADIRSRSIPGSDLRDRTVGLRQLTTGLRRQLNVATPGSTAATGSAGQTGSNGSTGSTGPTGPAGPAGPTGANGATSVRIRISPTVTVNPNSSAAAVVSCNSGETAVGGGSSGGGIDVGESFPTVGYGDNTPVSGATPTGWHASAGNKNATARIMSAYVLCAAR